MERIRAPSSRALISASQVGVKADSGIFPDEGQYNLAPDTDSYAQKNGESTAHCDHNLPLPNAGQKYLASHVKRPQIR